MKDSYRLLVEELRDGAMPGRREVRIPRPEVRTSIRFRQPFEKIDKRDVARARVLAQPLLVRVAGDALKHLRQRRDRREDQPGAVVVREARDQSSPPRKPAAGQPGAGPRPYSGP